MSETKAFQSFITGRKYDAVKLFSGEKLVAEMVVDAATGDQVCTDFVENTITIYHADGSAESKPRDSVTPA